MPIQQLPNGRWRVQLRRKGLPKFDKVFPSQAEAKAAEQQQLALPSQAFVGLELTVRDLWERYSTSIEFKQKAQNTQNTETTRIKPVLAELGDYALKHLESSPVLVYDFIDKRAASVSERTGKPLSPTSLRLEIAALSAICIWAKRRRMIRENFVRLISRPGQASRKRRVGVKEQAGINDALTHENPRVREAARFSRLIRLLGCRPGELAELRCVDIDYKASSVTFRLTKFKKEDRTVHATEGALETLSQQVGHINEVAPESPYLFPTRRRDANPGQRDTWYGPYNYAWGVKLMRKHGFVDVDFYPHALRREFVSRAIEDGLPYSLIRKQTGHHSTAAIELYDRGLATAPEVREAFDRHAKTIGTDHLAGLLLQYGLSEENTKDVMDRVLRKPKRIAVDYEMPKAADPIAIKRASK